jgi:hypothetical protein
MLYNHNSQKIEEDLRKLDLRINDLQKEFVVLVQRITKLEKQSFVNEKNIIILKEILNVY